MPIELDFLIRNSHKFETLCRICLKESDEGSVSLFELNNTISISDKVMSCTNIKIQHNDGLPRVICAQCAGELDMVDKFKNKCEYSDGLLRKFYLQCVLKDEDSKGYSAAHAWDHAIKVEFKNEDIDGASKDKIDDIKLEDADLVLNEDTNHSDDQNSIVEIDNSNANAESLKKFKCNICGRPLSTKYSLENHVARMHREGKRKLCTVSGYGKSRKYHCTECPYSTSYSQSLTYHSRVHSGERPYHCLECPRTFTQPGSLAEHRKSHSDKTYYTCAQCGKQFKLKHKFERHKLVHSDVRKHACETCNKCFKTKSYLNEHKKRHLNVRNYTCESCGSAFLTCSDLLNHARSHSSEKKFECIICGFKTKRNRILLKHMLLHSGERSFKCEYCEFTTHGKGKLKRHTMKHTRVKKYTCHVCQEMFTFSCSLNRHMLRLHGSKRKVSDVADKRFASKEEN